MSQKNTKSSKAARKLLRAIDNMLAAAREAQQARDELRKSHDQADKKKRSNK